MNFPLILFLILVVTGIACLIDFVWLRKQRPAGDTEPWWVDWSKSFFPVILVVFVLRSFVVEPFKIPSSSMRPLLEVGDFILVNKFAYGIRLPIIEKKVIDIGTPKRGDVMVFRYPRDPSMDYIKRVIGVPGDKISYHDKQLHVNGKAMTLTADGSYRYFERNRLINATEHVSTERLVEDLGTVKHPVLHDPRRPSFDIFADEPALARKYCEVKPDRLECTVPPNHFFMMGDNRDNSSDGRKWGFVPEDHIRGKAFFIWFNFDFDKTPIIDFGRIGNSVQ